jgi:hypothetical protein
VISDALKEDIKRQLPELLREDPEFREYILDIARPKFADKKDTQDRFYEILADLQRDREEQAKKWEEHREWLNPTSCLTNLVVVIPNSCVHGKARFGTTFLF